MSGVERLATVVFTHTGETCRESDCGLGFGYSDTDTVEERRQGCAHVATAVLDWLKAELAAEGMTAAVREAIAKRQSGHAATAALEAVAERLAGGER